MQPQIENIVLGKIQKILSKNKKKINELKSKKYLATTIIELNGDIFNSKDLSYKLDYVYFEEFKSIAEEQKKLEDKVKLQREKWNAQKRKYRQKNKEMVLAKNRAYYHKNKDKILPKIYQSRKLRKIKKDKDNLI